jgi:hypothetical protein
MRFRLVRTHQGKAETALRGSVERHVAQRDVIRGCTLPCRQGGDGLHVERRAVQAHQHSFRGAGDVPLVAQRSHPSQHGLDRVGMDEFRERMPTDLIGVLRPDPPDRRQVRVDDPAVPVHGDAVGAAIHQPTKRGVADVCIPSVGTTIATGRSVAMRTAVRSGHRDHVSGSSPRLRCITAPCSTGPMRPR